MCRLLYIRAKARMKTGNYSFMDLYPTATPISLFVKCAVRAVFPSCSQPHSFVGVPRSVRGTVARATIVDHNALRECT